jgi:hypothetical protein
VYFDEGLMPWRPKGDQRVGDPLPVAPPADEDQPPGIPAHAPPEPTEDTGKAPSSMAVQYPHAVHNTLLSTSHVAMATSVRVTQSSRIDERNEGCSHLGAVGEAVQHGLVFNSSTTLMGTCESGSRGGHTGGHGHMAGGQ